MQDFRTNVHSGRLRAIALTLSWSVIASLVGLLLFGPVFVVLRGFDRWVDVPACRELCVSKGLTFQSFHAAGKGGTYCTCAGVGGTERFSARFTVTGGNSGLAYVFDWFVRTGATILALGVWVGAAFFGASWWRKRRSKSTVRN
jgi:hypothetical protein